MTPGDAALVGAAGLLAGAINAVAGGGTLLSFPALLAVGLSPVTANVTSSVGLLSGYVGGSVAYRRELADQRPRLLSLLPAAVLGGAVGAVLLLLTPNDAFRALVPYLVLISCALLAAQPRLARALARRNADDIAWAARVGVGIASVYGSYFGAGLGVLLLAVLGVLVSDELQRLNALKGLLSLVVNVVGVVVFVAAAQVAWAYAALLAVTAGVGGTLGVGLARRLPPALLRLSVVCLGTVVGVVLLLS
ncbi:MAG: sulfite exporter TauE/SafE family protein [Mycobacteriales bacterium]